MSQRRRRRLVVLRRLLLHLCLGQFPPCLPKHVDRNAHAPEIHRAAQVARPLAAHRQVQNTVEDAGGKVFGRADVEVFGVELGVCSCKLIFDERIDVSFGSFSKSFLSFPFPASQGWMGVWVKGQFGRFRAKRWGIKRLRRMMFVWTRQCSGFVSGEAVSLA